MKFGAKVYNMNNGLTQHVTGTWANATAMEHDLKDDGLIVLTYWKEKE